MNNLFTAGRTQVACPVAILVAAMTWGLGAAPPARADVRTKAVQEAVDYVLRKFGREVAEEGAETVAKRIESFAVQHGDDALEAVKKVGPQAMRLADEAGEQGLHCVQLMAKFGDQAVWIAAQPKRLAIFAKYGDDAAEAMIRHGEIAEELVETAGKSAAAALKQVGKENGRRIAIMARDGELAAIGRTDELLGVVGRFGDRAMDFIWKHKRALASGTVLAAFLADPQPFLDGARDLAQVVAENAIKPLAEATGDVAQAAARQIDWTLFAVAAVAILGSLAALRVWLNHRLATRWGRR